MQEKELSFDYDKFDIERPFVFAAHTSFGCGGSAKIAFYPKTQAELALLLGELKRSGKEWVIVGNLTNTLASDLGTDKVVVCTKKMTKVFVRENENTVYAEAGITSAALLSILRKARLGGAEFLTGIPCTLGGALYMNAGAAGKYIAELVRAVRIYREGEVLELPTEACEYSYKHSLFMQNRDVILGATLAVKKCDLAFILEQEKYFRERRKRLPRGKSAGCIFKNPQNYSAGELIEKAGLKGLRVGGAKVSEVHANFIVNDGNATAREIRALIELVKNAVFVYCGVVLEEEIQYIY